jgi:DNA-damage-inducible protein D
MENQLTVFDNKPIRRIEHEGEIFFSIVDIIEVLTDSPTPKRYWADLKRRSEKESGQGYAFCVPLKLEAADGRKRPTDCANTEGVLRIVMSIPSPKAEPLKLWLAQSGKQTLDETENPELLTERQAELYRAKGYTEEWIGRRVQSIETRKALTDEWRERGVKENQEYAILTATIAKGTFDLTPTEHKEIKGLDRQNLRDHMTPIELIFTALGEEATRMVTIENDAQGFNENHDAASEGGRLAGNARRNFEKDRGKPIVSAQNYLNIAGDDKPEKLADGETK